MRQTEWNPRTRRKLISEVWARLGGQSVGLKELVAIQAALRRRLGGGAVESPAAIARVLADEGAELRHPEVIECDACWRAKRIEKPAGRSFGDPFHVSDRPLTLVGAARLIAKLEKIRERGERGRDKTALRRVRELAIAEKQRAQAVARSAQSNSPVRAEQVEIAQWFIVWLQTPGLFGDWLDLRRRSPDFCKRFSTEKHE